MLTRDFLKLLGKATIALTAPPVTTSALKSTIFPAIAELFPKDLLDSFLDYKLVRSLRLGQKETDPHPYEALEKASRNITDLLDCIQNPSPTKYRFIPPNFRLLQLLGSESLWGRGLSEKISLEAWAQFGEAVENHVKSVKSLPDLELLKLFPETKSEAKRKLNLSEFEDPLLLKMAELHREKVMGKDGVASGIRTLIGYRQEFNQGIRPTLTGINAILNSDPTGLFAKNPDALALLQHLQEFGFSPFPVGSRLAQIQSIARAFRQFNSLQGKKALFEKQKTLAEQLYKESKELGFDLPLDETINSARFSSQFEDHQSRSTRPGRKNPSYQNDILHREGFIEDLYLIYNFTPQGPIVNILMANRQEFRPLHVQFSALSIGVIMDALWENLEPEKLLSKETLLLKMHCNLNEIIIEASEIGNFRC